MTNPAAIFDAYVPRPLPAPKAAKVFAPSNIALSKYWGKRDKALNLPLNSSLSISLGQWGTETSIAPAEADSLTFNGEVMAPTTPAAAKVWRFVDLFCGAGRPALQVETTNSIPTAAGLASSASGFAALTAALNAAFATDLPKETQSMLARFGSGSATRSFWHGFARWDVGQAADGTDSRAHLIDATMPTFRIAIVAVDTGPKAQSSTDGMTHTVATSPLYPPWPEQAEMDCAAIEAAVRGCDFNTLGQLAEDNALAMHATMMAARPAVTYLKPHSWVVLETLWSARRDGLQAFATMDAGANVKLIFEDASTADIAALFPKAQIINPWDTPPEGSV